MKKIVGILAAAMIMTGCGKEKPSPLGNLGEPSLSDSLIYYYGLLQGREYLKIASHDSVLNSRAQRELYLKGLKDGLRAVEELNATYNRGLQNGIEMALTLYDFNATYGIDFNRDLLYQSIAYSLESDDIAEEGKLMKDYHDVIEKLDLKRRRDIVKEMHLTLPEEAKRLRMKKVTDNLYVTDSNVGSGNPIRRGDIVFSTCNYILENGRNLEMPSTQQITVGGPTMSETMIRVYTRMRNGGSAEYATTAGALFGGRAEQLGLNPSEVILMSVEINNVVNPDSVGKRRFIAV